MTWDTWNAVDEYTAGLLIGPNPVLEAALQASAAAGLPEIAVTPNQGKLLALLARMHGARSILEVGTLGGYSTIWLARALPADGRLVTLELNPDFALVASENIERAGLSDLVQALELSRPGGAIVVDNVVRDGALVDPDSSDPGVAGMRRFLAMAAAEPRVTATTIQTVGSKGYDGFTLALVQDI